MNVRIPESGHAPTSIAWRGECCIESLAERLPELLAASDADGPVSLDLSELSRIDAAGLQLLLVFVLDCERRSRAFTWRGSSRALLEAAEVTGLRAALGLSENS